jgi:hypothetical protein
MNRCILYTLLLLPALLTAQEYIGTDSLFSTRFNTYTVYELTKDQIGHLPVRELSAYLQLFNGIVIQDGNVHVRGGRDDEAAYFIDGFSSVNPLDNSNALYVIPEAIERLRVLPGFFPARYGAVNSGLIFTDLKKGTSDLRFFFDYQTDQFAEAGEQFLGTYSYRDQIFTATASGPLSLSNLCFFVALENTRIGDAAKRFSSGFSFHNLVDQHYRFRDDDDAGSNFAHCFYKPIQTIDATNEDVPDTISLVYPDGFTPFNNRNSWNVNATMQYNLNPFTLDLTLVYNWDKVFANDRPMLEILNRRQDFLKYNISLGYYDNRSEKFDAYFDNNWQLWGDSAAVSQATDGDVIYRQAFSSLGPWFYNLINSYII